jgi:hypothetical protein
MLGRGWFLVNYWERSLKEIAAGCPILAFSRVEVHGLVSLEISSAQLGVSWRMPKTPTLSQKNAKGWGTLGF